MAPPRRGHLHGVLILALVLLPAALPASADTPRIVEGIVRDQTGLVLPGVTVVLLPARLETLAGADGHFRFDNLQPGHYRVTASLPGLGTGESRALDVVVDGAATIDLVLTATLAEEVVVTGTRTRLTPSEAPVRTEVIPTRAIEQLAPRTLADTLEFTPGIRVENNYQNCNFSQIRLIDRVEVVKGADRRSTAPVRSAASSTSSPAKPHSRVPPSRWTAVRCTAGPASRSAPWATGPTRTASPSSAPSRRPTAWTASTSPATASQKSAGGACIVGSRGAVPVFWATWCPHCLADLPAWSRLHFQAASCGSPIVGIPVDVMPRQDMAAWLQRQSVDWPQVFDGRGLSGPLARRYRIEAVPAVLLIDAAGRTTAAGVGLQALEPAIEARCAAPARSVRDGAFDLHP